MRYDIFDGRKSIHIKLKKELHASLREKLFKYGLTMQDLFQEAAEMVLVEGGSDRLLHRIVKKKLAANLEKVSRQEKLVLGDLDSETLYNLLEVETSDGTKEKE